MILALYTVDCFALLTMTQNNIEGAPSVALIARKIH